MKIGIWSQHPDISEIVRHCRAAGVDSVTVGPEVAPGYRERGVLDPQALRRVVETLGDAGIEVPAFIGSMASDPEVLLTPEARRDAIERELAVIRSLGEAGIGVLINYVHTPEPSDAAQDEQLWDGLIRLLREYVSEAERSNVRIASHGVWKCLPEPLRSEAIDVGVSSDDYRGYRRADWIGPFLVRSADHIRRMVDAVPSPRNGICLCTGMYITGADPVVEAERFGDKVHFVQIRDIANGRWPASDEVFPGAGDIDFFRMIQRLLASGYDGYAHAEHLGASRLADGAPPGGFESWELEIAAAAYAEAMVDAATRSLETR